MPLLIILGILLGGASVAADQSLPGDVLYPIKISINEEARGWFAISEEAKAALETKLAERRLEEAEKLAIRGDLNAETRVRLEENFKKHAEKVEARVNKIENTDSAKALELASNFDTSLEAHTKILNSIGASLDGNTEPEIKKLRIVIEDKKDDTEKNKEDNEDKVKEEKGADVQSAAEGKLKAATNKIAEVRKFIEKHNDRFDSQTKGEAEARLKLAEDALAQGKTKLETKSYGEAFALFQKAHSMAQEAKLLFMAKVEFEDDDDDNPSPSVTSGPSLSPSPSPSTSVSPSPHNGREDEDGHWKVKVDLDLD